MKVETKMQTRRVEKVIVEDVNEEVVILTLSKKEALAMRALTGAMSRCSEQYGWVSEDTLRSSLSADLVSKQEFQTTHYSMWQSLKNLFR